MTIACPVKTLIPVELSELMSWILTCYESDERSNWWCHVARMNCYASVFIVNLRVFSSNFSLAWLWFICNLVASTDNRLLLQHRRWRAPVLELVAARMAIMMTYRRRRRRPLRSSLPSSWGAKGQWKKLCASSCKTPLVATHINQGRAKSAQYIQGISGYEASNFQGGWGTTVGWWVAQHHWVEISSAEGHRASES